MTWPLKTKFYLEKDGEKFFWIVDDSCRISDRVISGASPLGKCLLEAKPGKFSFKQPNGRIVKYFLLKIEVPHLNHNQKRKEVPHPNHKQGRKEVPHPNQKQKRKEVPHSNHNQRRKEVSHSNHKQGRKEVPDPNHKQERKDVTVCNEIENRKKDIKERVLSRRIPFLVHFTSIDNLESILENGLLSRTLLEEKKMKYDYSDGERRDNYLECISTSISFPNYKMFFKKRIDSNCTWRWAIILLKREILWELECKFFSSNSAYGFFKTLTEAELSTVQSFDKMFLELPSRSCIPDHYTTDPQAEVLIKGKIPQHYFLKVGVETFYDKWNLKHLEKLIDLEVMEDLFKYRSDYSHWSSQNY